MRRGSGAHMRLGLRLGLHLAHRRMGHSLMYLLLGIVLAALTVGSASISASATEAIETSAAANLGGRAYVAETDSSEAKSVLAGLDGVSGVLDSSGYVTTATGSLDATLRMTDDPTLVLGSLVDGQPARAPGDVLITRALARSLRIGVGDTVNLSEPGDSGSSATVAGITVDTADVGARVIQILTDTKTASAATRWVSDRDSSSDFPELIPFVTAYEVTTGSRDSAQASALENQPTSIAILAHVPFAAPVIVSFLIVCFIASLIRTWTRDVDALVAAGWAPARGWHLMGAVAAGILLTGTVIGTASTLAAVNLTRSSLSGLLGQDWVDVAVPAKTMLALVGGIVAVGVLGVPVVRWLGRAAERVSPASVNPRWVTMAALGLVVGATAVLATSLTTTASDAGTDQRARAFMACLILAVCLPLLLVGGVGLGLPRARRRLTQAAAAAFVAVSAVTSLVAVGIGTWVALEFSDAATSEAASADLAQPEGSLVISAVPDSAVAKLQDRYTQLGGGAITSYRLASDADTVWRAISPSSLACVDAALSIEAALECGEVYPVALSGSDQTVASPLLVENSYVGLIAIDPDRGAVTDIASASAVADPDLGYLLPGLVFSIDNASAAGLGVVASSLSMVVLNDFETLSVDDRLAMRSYVLSLSPTATMSDATRSTAYQEARSTATGVAIGGGVLTALVMFLGGGSVVLAHESTRRTLIDVGLAPAPRLGLVARWAAVPAVCLLLGACVLTPATATGGWSLPISALGWPWLLPYVTGLIATAAVARAYLEPPREAAE